MFRKILLLSFVLVGLSHFTESYRTYYQRPFSYHRRPHQLDRETYWTSSSSTPPYQNSPPRDLLSTLNKFVELGQGLKFGDSCSWEAEQLRQNYTLKLFNNGVKEEVIEMAGTFVDNGWKLCSALELFVCDKESQKCVCGSPVQEAVQGLNRNKFFEENGKCRWNEGTYCIPKQYMKTRSPMMNIRFDSKCKSGTVCKTGGGRFCSKQGLLRYLLHNYGFGVLLNEKRLRKELMSGRVCSCQKRRFAKNPVIGANGDVIEDNSEDLEFVEDVGGNDAQVGSDSEEGDVVAAPARFTSTTTTTSTTQRSSSIIFEDDDDDNQVIFEWEEQGDIKRRKRSINDNDGVEVAFEKLAEYVAGPEITVDL